MSGRHPDTRASASLPDLPETQPASVFRPCRVSFSAALASACSAFAPERPKSCCPPILPNKPGARGAPKRASTASIACSPTVRPNRASHAAGNESVLRIVPVATPSAMKASFAFDNVSVSVSPSSLMMSSSTGTSMTARRLPGGMLSVPDTAV